MGEEALKSPVWIIQSHAKARSQAWGSRSGVGVALRLTTPGRGQALPVRQLRAGCRSAWLSKGRGYGATGEQVNAPLSRNAAPPGAAA